MSFLHALTGSLIAPWIRYRSRRSLPQVEGTVRLPGLESEATLRRDAHGIARIRAKSRSDLYFAQGFAHAQDRLWQMELHRRIALGQMAEILGPTALNTDRLIRTLGFHKVAEESWKRTTPRVRAYYEAYASGVNAFLESGTKLPVEFSLLKHRPNAWKPHDTVSFICFQGWMLSHGWSSAITRSRLIDKVGAEAAAELDFHYPEEHPVTIPGAIRDLDKLLHPHRREGAGRGSNGWAISADRSTTGHAILANDMHLPLQTPSLWYAMELESEEDGHHVSGATIAGTPAVWVGQNDHIGWGATLAFIDCEDLVLEKLDPADETRYRFRDEWKEAEVRTERIHVKGAPDHEEKVVTTHHGPLLHRILPGPGDAVSIRSTALKPYDTLDSLVCLNEAKNWDEFRSAVSRLGATQLNIVYADREDNIGYWMTGRIPIRTKAHGGLPVPGWTGDHEWTGMVPPEENPHVFNPEKGYIITCNNRIADDSYPHELGDVYMNGFRAQRLEDLINTREKISPEDCTRFQFDVHSIPGTKMVALLQDLEPAHPDAQLALELLRKWNGELETESVGGAVYQVFFASLSRAILLPRLGEELFHELLGKGPHPIVYPTTEFFGQWTVSLLRMLGNPESGWISDREALLADALRDSVVELRKSLGTDPSGWRWGRLHRACFPHMMSKKPPLDRVFNPKPLPVGGDTDTVHQTASLPDAPHENNNYSPSWRQVLNLQNPKKSGAMIAPGQSGQIGSAHYEDLVRPWSAGEYFPLRNPGEHRTLTLIPSP